ncbi:hypothetical protein STSP2_00945 [Anaerohalosphaera lusitana]|uniref:Ice-binding protein C-terminal domain-containing protein n=1 Tax=Anaerohalosphaera lusitana TaxID=1936003 RepID=A0A1U9NJW2_9BACT|nr:PEP-CTERM sorting domain-containing protein [Anaerohalosphaera lusitana]AQT67796.1 hypothetical protein STSP2_00945 [Anaerohalosphaera lusitana]
MKLTIKTLLALTVLFTASYAQASPVALDVTNHSESDLRAVLWGGLAETDFVYDDGMRTWQSSWQSDFWSLQATIIEEYRMGAMLATLKVEAQHLTGLHDGEVAPGFVLDTMHINLTGDPRFAISAEPVRISNKIHPGAVEHHDVLHTFVMDLDQNLPGLLSGDGQIYAVIEAAHVMPEPATLVLIGVGALALAGCRKR